MKVLTMIVNKYLEKNLCCELWFSSACAHISQKECEGNMRLHNGIIGILTNRFWYTLDDTIILQRISDGRFFFGRAGR